MDSLDFIDGALGFRFTEVTNCEFSAFGVIIGVGGEVIEGIEEGSSFIDNYTPVVLNTGKNFIYIQVPNTIVDVLSSTNRNESLLDSLVAIEGVVATRFVDGTNLVEGNRIRVSDNTLLASGLRLIGDTEDLDDVLGSGM